MIGGAAAIVALLIGISLFAFGREYLLSPAIADTSQLIPRDAAVFVEIRSPAKLLELWRDSRAGRRLAELPPYQNLRATPQLAFFNNISYLLELKTGLNAADIVSGVDRPVGVALMPDDSFLLVARTDLKSRVGIRLLENLKGKTIQLPNENSFGTQTKPAPASEGETAGDESVVNREDSPPVLLERRTELGNLEITQIDSGDRNIYMVLLGDIFFLSDSLEVLEASLSLAGSPDAKSLANLEGMPKARAALVHEDSHALFFATNRSGTWAPLTAMLGGDQGLIAVLKTEGAAPAAFDLFAAGSLRFGKPANVVDQKNQAPAFQKVIPADAIINVYSTRDSTVSLLEYFDDLGGVPEELADRFQKFRAVGGLATPGTAEKSPGISLAFTGFERDRDALYPHVVLGLPGETSATTLNAYRTAIFGAGDAQTVTFQNIQYSRTDFLKRRYAPTIVELVASDARHSGTGLLATRPADITAAISASQGTRPAVSDQPAFVALQDRSDDPIHVSVNLNELRLAVRQFFEYGAARSDEYSDKTITRDVMPLLDAFQDYGSIHVAAGSSGPVYGKIVIAAN